MHQRARIAIPWNLTLHDRASLGDRTNAYSLGEIEVGAGAVIAQEAYLSTGSHDFAHPAFPLVVAKITVGEGAFVGARAFVMPGVTIGARAIVGACSVVTADVPEDVVAAGNPCRVLRASLGAGQRLAEAGHDLREDLPGPILRQPSTQFFELVDDAFRQSAQEHAGFSCARW